MIGFFLVIVLTYTPLMRSAKSTHVFGAAPKSKYKGTSVNLET